MLNVNGIFTYIYHKFKPNVGQYSTHGAFAWVCKCLRFICVFFGVFFCFLNFRMYSILAIKTSTTPFGELPVIPHLCGALFHTFPNSFTLSHSPKKHCTDIFWFKILLHLRKKRRKKKDGQFFKGTCISQNCTQFIKGLL